MCPNFKNTSSRFPFNRISFNFWKLIQTNDNGTHQKAGSFYRLHWNAVDMNSCRTQWCSYMRRTCDICVNRWCIHQHLRIKIQGADVSNIFHFFKATCNCWFYYWDALSLFLRAFYSGKKKKTIRCFLETKSSDWCNIQTGGGLKADKLQTCFTRRHSIAGFWTWPFTLHCFLNKSKFQC